MRSSVLFFLFAASAILVFPRIVLSDAVLFSTRRTRLDPSAGKKRLPAATKTPAKSDKLKDKSFIGSKNWKGDGSIVESKDEKLNLSTGDFVYTSLGSYDVKEGTICDISVKGTR